MWTQVPFRVNGNFTMTFRWKFSDPSLRGCDGGICWVVQGWGKNVEVAYQGVGAMGYYGITRSAAIW